MDTEIEVEVGKYITMWTIDTRWWRVLLYKLLGMSLPIRSRKLYAAIN